VGRCGPGHGAGPEISRKWAIPDGQYNVDFVRALETISCIELVEIELKSFVEEVVASQTAEVVDVDETEIANEQDERTDEEKKSPKQKMTKFLRRQRGNRWLRGPEPCHRG
jgi:hypothetical protein